MVSQLGRLLGLPVPPTAFIHVPNDFIQSCSLFNKYDFSSGNQFASLYIHNCPSLPKEAAFPKKDQILNQDVLPGLFVFDLWVSNQDRWKNNILLKPMDDEKYYLYLIDHSDCFPGGTHWSLASLHKRTGLKKLRSVHQWCLDGLTTRQELYDFSDRIQILPDDQIGGVIHSIPLDWEVSKEERKALVQHLKRGKLRLRQLIHEYTPALV